MDEEEFVNGLMDEIQQEIQDEEMKQTIIQQGITDEELQGIIDQYIIDAEEEEACYELMSENGETWVYPHEEIVHAMKDKGYLMSFLSTGDTYMMQFNTLQLVTLAGIIRYSISMEKRELLEAKRHDFTIERNRLIGTVDSVKILENLYGIFMKCVDMNRSYFDEMLDEEKEMPEVGKRTKTDMEWGIA